MTNILLPWFGLRQTVWLFSDVENESVTSWIQALLQQKIENIARLITKNIMEKIKRIFRKINDDEADDFICVFNVGNNVYLRSKINKQVKHPADMNKMELVSLLNLVRCAERHIVRMIEAGEETRDLLRSIGM